MTHYPLGLDFGPVLDVGSPFGASFRFLDIILPAAVVLRTGAAGAFARGFFSACSRTNRVLFGFFRAAALSARLLPAASSAAARSAARAAMSSAAFLAAAASARSRSSRDWTLSVFAFFAIEPLQRAGES